MFETADKEGGNVFRLSLRISYILVAMGINIGVFYSHYFPGTTKDDRFGSFFLGIVFLIASLIFSVLVIAYVVWKLVKLERPVFWIIAFFVTAFPVLWVAAQFIFDIRSM